MTPRPLAFESLEDRRLLYSVSPFGGFASPEITYSFPPAGAAFSRNTTVEVSRMWKDCVREALENIQEAANEAGIPLSFREVADDGSPHAPFRGADGRVHGTAAQGHPGYGDMRFAEIDGKVAGSTLDLAWYSWMPSDSSAAGGNSMVSLKHTKLASVMADHHQMDHFTTFLCLKMLGVGHSTVPGAVMNRIFAENHELAPDDLAALAALYGTASPPTAAPAAASPESPTAVPGVPTPAQGPQDGQERREERREARQETRREHRDHVREMVFSLFGTLP